MAANKSDAHAIQAFGTDNYAAMPKSLLAMIAYSFAQRLAEDGNRDKVLAEIAREWDALHVNGIVPQKPKALETLEQEAARIEGYAVTQDPSSILGKHNRERVMNLRSQITA